MKLAGSITDFQNGGNSIGRSVPNDRELLFIVEVPIVDELLQRSEKPGREGSGSIPSVTNTYLGTTHLKYAEKYDSTTDNILFPLFLTVSRDKDLQTLVGSQSSLAVHCHTVSERTHWLLNARQSRRRDLPLLAPLVVACNLKHRLTNRDRNAVLAGPADCERNEQGRYVETVSPDTVLAVIQHAADPIVTAKEVGEKLDCTPEAARQKLLRLQNQGIVARRKVGAGAVVWWLVDEDQSTTSTEFDADDSLFAEPTTFASGASDASRNTEEYLADAIAGERESTQ